MPRPVSACAGRRVVARYRRITRLLKVSLLVGGPRAAYTRHRLMALPLRRLYRLPSPARAAKPVTPCLSSLTKCNVLAGPLRVQSTSFEVHSNNTETTGEERETLDANFDCRRAAGCRAGWLCDRTGAGLLRRGLLPSWVLLLINTGSRSMRQPCAAREARASDGAEGNPSHSPREPDVRRLPAQLTQATGLPSSQSEDGRRLSSASIRTPPLRRWPPRWRRALPA